MKIVYILSAPQMSGFLEGQISAMKSAGFMPIIFTPQLSDQVIRIAKKEGAEVIVAPMQRKISPIKDLIGAIRIAGLLQKIKPQITFTIGPKAGLLAGVAAWYANVPCRIQTKWGIRLETARGLLRLVLICADKIAAGCAHLILCDSQSGRSRTIELGLAPDKKVKVVANGSANGINIEKFIVCPATLEMAKNFRVELGISNIAPLVGFIGRINADKGLIELGAAWEKIRQLRVDATLVVIGENECQSSQELAALKKLTQTSGVKILGSRTGVEGLLLAMDVLLMPSHREGFGVVVLEAAAMGVPTVGFNVTGMKDSVVHEKTGILVELGDTDGLAKATLNYLNNAELRKLHGLRGRDRVRQDFQQLTVWKGYFDTIRQIASERNLDVSKLKWS